MATYVPNASNTAEPTSSRFVGSAAEEFRTLKTKLVADVAALNVKATQTLRAPGSETLSALPVAATRAAHLPYFGPTGDVAVTPFTVDQIASAIAAAYVGGTTADAIGWINELSGSEAQSLQTALRRRRVNIFDCLTLAEQLDVLARGHNFDIGAKIQAFSNAVYLRGSGVIEFPDGDYCHSDELWIKQRVLWEGETACFREPYSDPYPAPEGAVLFKLAGSNNNGVLIKCDLTLASGVLYDTGFGTSKRNNGARHGGGIRNMTVWGNRSANPTFGNVDRNNAGSGVVAVAARNVHITGVTSMMWADDCFNFGTYDYGSGLLGVNVARISGCTAMSSNRDGLGGTIGDSRITDTTIGFCARHGVSMYLGNTVLNAVTAWNCGRAGFYCSGFASSGTAMLVGCFAYDNDSNGFIVDGAGGGRAATLIGCGARGNGRNATTYPNAQDRANFYVTSTAQHWAILACVSNTTDQGGVLTSSYAFYLNNYQPGRFEASTWDGAELVMPVYIAQPGHLGAPTFGEPAEIHADAADIRTSITGNNLDVGSVDEIVFNSATPITVNTISSTSKGRPEIFVRNAGAGSVTFTHGSSTIKINSGANLVMTTGQGYTFRSINSGNTIWQQRG